MEILCTRPGCPKPQNIFADLDNTATLKTAQQKYCTSCGMPLLLAGRYLPTRLLGRGGFGAAYLARDRYTPTMRYCVVKQFQPSGNLDPQTLELAQKLFEREAEVLEQLGNKHPQIPDLFAFFPLIVPRYQAGKETQFFYIVQEFIDGQTLEEEMATKGKFSEAETRLVLEEMLKVLQFVHDNGSIHRDIKPSNIMRDRNGLLHLLDFGAVKQVAAVAAGNNPSARSTGIYSMGFAPPEQMAGGQVYPSTDLYALAVTCLYLLTGKPAEELYDPYHNNWNWKPHAPQVSPQLGIILDRMLLATPKDRFQSAEKVIQALNFVPSHHPKTSLQPPLPSPTPSPPPTPQGASLAPPPSPTPSPPPARIKKARSPSISAVELLGDAAFTGFEATLLLTVLITLIPTANMALGVWGMIMGGLIFAQLRRIIEKFDLIIFILLSIGVLWVVTHFLPTWVATIPNKISFIKIIQDGLITAHLPIFQNLFYVVILVSVLGGIALFGVTALFRLIFQLLSQIF